MCASGDLPASVVCAHLGRCVRPAERALCRGPISHLQSGSARGCSCASCLARAAMTGPRHRALRFRVREITSSSSSSSTFGNCACKSRRPGGMRIGISPVRNQVKSGRTRDPRPEPSTATLVLGPIRVKVCPYLLLYINPSSGPLVPLPVITQFEIRV